MQALQKNIQQYGLVDPIIINLHNNHIIGGHQRYNALLKTDVTTLNLLRLGDIGWAYTSDTLDLPDDINHEKALNLSLNKIQGMWDEGKLRPLLVDLTEKHFNIELTGFNKVDLVELDVDTTFLDQQRKTPTTMEGGGGE